MIKMKEKEELTNKTTKIVNETEDLIITLENNILNKKLYKHPPDLQEALESAVSHLSVFLTHFS